MDTPDNLIPFPDRTCELPPNWSLSTRRGRILASRKYIAGELAAATLVADTEEEAIRAARRFEGIDPRE